MVGCTPAGSSFCVGDDCGYDDGAPFLIGAADDPSRPAGLTKEYKIGARLDPLTKAGEKSWHLSGCYYFHGLEMRQVVLALAFDSENRGTVIPLADVIAPETRESTFTTTIQRPNGDPIRGAYISFSWRKR